MTDRVIWPPRLAFGPLRAEVPQEQIETVLQFSRWVVLAIKEGKPPNRWVIRNICLIQELVDKLARGDPYTCKLHGTRWEGPDEYPEGESFVLKAGVAAWYAEVVEIIIPTKGITLYVQQAFDQPELAGKALRQREEELQANRERAEEARAIFQHLSPATNAPREEAT